MDPEPVLICIKSSLLEVQILIKDGPDRETSDFSIGELPTRIIGGIPKEDITALVLVIWHG